MWCWRRMEKISWTDHVRNEEVLRRVNEQRNILHEIRKRKANWIGHILRRNCLLKQVIERKKKGEMEVTRRQARRRKKLLDDLKDRRGYSHLKEEALDRTMWRNRFGGGFGSVIRQNTKWMNEWMNEWMYIYIYIYIEHLLEKCNKKYWNLLWFFPGWIFFSSDGRKYSVPPLWDLGVTSQIITGGLWRDVHATDMYFLILHQKPPPLQKKYLNTTYISPFGTLEYFVRMLFYVASNAHSRRRYS